MKNKHVWTAIIAIISVLAGVLIGTSIFSTISSDVKYSPNAAEIIVTYPFETSEIAKQTEGCDFPDAAWIRIPCPWGRSDGWCWRIPEINVECDEIMCDRENYHGYCVDTDEDGCMDSCVDLP
ncbi:hypothetical protein HY450_00205 [Candidatus Pacearchaeota archaeon]|nr:hypothetical protein [Candidatus Pacearchaeota archaeon]